MMSPRENEAKERVEAVDEHRLILDGTVNLDYLEDDQVPRVKGLVELLDLFIHGRN